MTDEKNQNLALARQKRVEKLEKKLSEDFLSKVQKSQQEEIKKMIIEHVSRLEHILAEKASHKELNSAKEIVSTINSSFRELTTPVKNQLDYLSLLLEEQKAEK